MEVYNALNHSDYRNPEEVEIIRLERGIAQGIQRGAEQEKLNTAVRMFKLQVPMEQIAQAVGESVGTVKSWLETDRPNVNPT